MLNYVLVTPAHNEERNIGRLIESVVSQTQRPAIWVIVDDGSTDATTEIVTGYAKQHSWIQLLSLRPKQGRSFARKVHAFNAGYERVKSVDFEIIGNLDSDLSFQPDYFEFLATKFEEDSRLGVAGTPFLENGYDSAQDSFEGENHVAGGAQMFRRACFEEIGGYKPNAAGGIDWVAVTTARMKGWKTRSFREKRFYHHRTLGTAERHPLAALFSYGEKDYYLGNAPLWEFFRFAYRGTKSPFLIGGLALFLGYCWAAVRRIDRAVSPELMRFHRAEEMRKLKAIFASLLKLRRPDAFSLSQAKSNA